LANTTGADQGWATGYPLGTAFAHTPLCAKADVERCGLFSGYAIQSEDTSAVYQGFTVCLVVAWRIGMSPKTAVEKAATHSTVLVVVTWSRFEAIAAH